MTDEEFLRYCETHCETPRAGFVPANIVRLLELANPQHQYLAMWKKREAKDPAGIRSFGPDDIVPLVAQARERLRNLAALPHVVMTVAPDVLVTLTSTLFKPENAGRYFGSVRESVRIAGHVGANGVIEITGVYEESDG